MVNLIKQVQIRTQLENKLFSQYGKTATLKKASSPIYNDWNEFVSDSWIETSITIVNYDIFSDRKARYKYGNLSEGDQECIIPYSETVTTDDRLVIDGVEYTIENVEKPQLPDLVVNIVRISKLQS